MDFIKNTWKNNSNNIWLVILRLTLGLEWFMAGLHKLLDPTYIPGIGGTIGFFGSAGNPNLWFQNVATNVFLTNPEVFGWLISVGELLVGVAFIFGALLNFAALAGVFMNLLFYFAAGWLSASTQSINWIMAILTLVLLISTGSKALSVDLFVAKKLEKPWLHRLLVDWFNIDKWLNKK
ncbi:MAG: DoxX family membrane protein [Asgard group archaeon]|nr:DoxX family membrane protein [Asgard group archaeon]